MAFKESVAEKKNKLLEILNKEYKFENIFLAFVAVLSIAFGIMILNGDFVVKEGFPILGDFPRVFAWALIGIALFGLLMVIYPFYEPAFPEFKKITWATRNELLTDIARVFSYMIIISLAFLFFDLIIKRIVGLIW